MITLYAELRNWVPTLPKSVSVTPDWLWRISINIWSKTLVVEEFWSMTLKKIHWDFVKNIGWRILITALKKIYWDLVENFVGWIILITLKVKPPVLILSSSSSWSSHEDGCRSRNKRAACWKWRCKCLARTQAEAALPTLRTGLAHVGQREREAKTKGLLF